MAIVALPLETDAIDWELDESNQLIFPLRYLRGTPAVAQRINIKLRFIKGEFFSDRSKGIPYLEGPTVPPEDAILAEPFNRGRIESIFRTALLEVIGVESVTSVSITFDGATRALDVTYDVVDIFGHQIAGTFSEDVIQ